MADHTLNTEDLATVFNIMIEGVVIQNEQGSIIKFNNAALTILGLTEDQLIGKTSYDPSWRAVNEDSSPANPDQNPSTLARKTGNIQKNRIMGIHRPDGELVWVSITAVPIKNKVDPPYSAVITFHEITEIIKLKKDIENKKRELKLVINSLPVLIGHWDRELRNVHANESYSFYFGKSPEQIKGMHIKDVLGDRLFELNYPFMMKALSGEPQEFEREIPLPSGGSKKTIANYIPEIKDGHVIGFFVIVTDITLLKKLELERREMESVVFNSARLTWLGEMAAGMSHEINNPLAITLGYIHILKMDLNNRSLSNESILSTLEKMDTSLKRVSRIVKDLSLFSKDGTKEMMGLVKISSIFESIQNLTSETLKKKNISFNIEPYEDKEIYCKSSQLSQVLMNLINNSVDAILELNDKWIDVSLIQQSNFLIIRIVDSGKGIDQIAEKIMDPFFTTKPPGKGTGLGLSISKTIMKDQHGDLLYIPKQQHTTFEIRIPTEQKF